MKKQFSGIKFVGIFAVSLAAALALYYLVAEGQLLACGLGFVATLAVSRILRGGRQ